MSIVSFARTAGRQCEPPATEGRTGSDSLTPPRRAADDATN